MTFPALLGELVESCRGAKMVKLVRIIVKLGSSSEMDSSVASNCSVLWKFYSLIMAKWLWSRVQGTLPGDVARDAAVHTQRTATSERGNGFTTRSAQRTGYGRS